METFATLATSLLDSGVAICAFAICTWLAFATLVAFAALKRGRSALGWFALAIVISPPVAGLLLMAMRDRVPVQLLCHIASPLLPPARNTPVTPSAGDTVSELFEEPREGAIKRSGGTSEAAAKSVRQPAGKWRKDILARLRQFPGGLTADELAEHLAMSILATRPRCSELVRLGEIKPSGQRRPTATGKFADVLVIAELQSDPAPPAHRCIQGETAFIADPSSPSARARASALWAGRAIRPMSGLVDKRATSRR